MRRGLLALLALVLPSAVLFGATASAAPKAAPPPPTPPPADVETAEQLYAKLDYDLANSVAERVTKLKGLTHDQLVRIYRVLAVTNAILDKEEQAKEAFILLLTFDPEYQVDPDLGPRITTPFAEARGFWRAQPMKPGLDVQLSIRVQEGGTIRVTLRDPTKIVKTVKLGYRWGATGEYAASTFAPNESMTAQVTPGPVGKTRVDYWVQAFDVKDDVAMEAGQPNIPKTVFAEASKGAAGGKDKPGFVGSTPFFIALGAVAAVGAGTAGFFLLRPKDPPTAAVAAPSLVCGADACR